MPINRILVATDGSLHARKALELSLEIAERFDAEVQLLNVLPEPVVKHYSPHDEEKKFESSSDVVSERKMLLEEELQHCKEINPSVKVSKRLVQGPVADKIIDIAESEKADLIAMGHKGLHLTKELIIGSKTREVAQKTSIPLLIVKK